MNETFSCHIIKDLIPLCSEGLCSEESRTAIEEHIKDCESCRKLYEQLPEMAASEPTVPDESKAFLKVHKKLKRGKLKIALLSVVLLAVLGGMGYLTYGQTKKEWGIQSFETIFQSIEVHHIAKMIAKGEIEDYVEQASVGDLFNSTVSAQELSAFRKKQTELIHTAFQEAFEGEELDSVKVKSEYTEYGMEMSKIIYSMATIYFKSGRQLEVHFTKGEDGLYGGSVIPSIAFSDAEHQFAKLFNYLDQQDLYPRGWLDQILPNDEPITDEKTAGVKTRYLTRHLGSEWSADIEERMIAFYLKGYYVTDFDVTPILYDREKELLYHEITFGAKDEKGSCILMTRLYVEADGMIPAPERNQIYADGCTDALADDLFALFS